MISQLKQNKRLFRRARLLLISLAVILIGLGLYFSWEFFLHEDVARLRMSSGRTVTRRHEIAQNLQHTSKQHGVDLTLISTAGSEEALKLVEKGELDLAIVSSGIVNKNITQVREVAALHVEPVHFLVRRELAEKHQFLREMVRNKRVNLGEPGSSAHSLSLELMTATQMKPASATEAGDFTVTTWGDETIVERLQQIQKLQGAEREAKLQELPDVLILVVSMPSLVAQQLINVADYRLVSIPFARAFILNTSHQNQLNSVIDHSYLEQATILAGSYLARRPEPAQDCPTLGMRLLLVANKQVSAKVIYRLMKCLYEGEFARRYKPVSPDEQASAYAIHLGALAYVNRNKTNWINEVVAMVKQGLSVLGLFSAGALSLFALLRTKQQKSPGDYLNEIRQIELIARGTIKSAEAPTERLALAHYLDQRLSQIKSDLIQACTKKHFKNEVMLLNVLTILMDTRQQIASLLSHHELQPGEASPWSTTISSPLKLAG